MAIFATVRNTLNIIISMKLFPLFAAVLIPAVASSATIKVDVSADPAAVDSSVTVPPEIYGQFAEHLGTCIYGGVWVGPDSDIPNTRGYRNDVLGALRDLKVPVIRWPGGCFADEYHWQDGIGPRSERPRMVNTNWGGTVEDNSFGTHEFFDLCELIGCEPYLSGNVGSGTVEELAKWVEYITAETGPMADRRRNNGREKPWRLKYLGVGNESWGCGGNFTPEDYAGVYRRYQTYCRDFNGNRLYKIASGSSGSDYNWTDVLMRRARNHMKGLSLHYYTVKGWTGSKGRATEFDDAEYYRTLTRAAAIEGLLVKHDSIMSIYDPDRKVALIVDEWGTWFDEEPGTVPGHLYQQNTMRDAMVASLSLNAFHRHTDRVKMANIAQLANVLQAMVLTRGDSMVLTPTYHVFRMYAPHQGGVVVPLTVSSPLIGAEGADGLPAVDVTATVRDGVTTVTLTNISLTDGADVTIPFGGRGKVTAEILTAPSIDSYNDFDHPLDVVPAPFKGYGKSGSGLDVKLPARSIVTLSIAGS